MNRVESLFLSNSLITVKNKDLTPVINIHFIYYTKGKVVKNMRNLLILIIIIFRLIQANGSLFNKISHANEVNIPVIDRNIPTNIETATFAMG